MLAVHPHLRSAMLGLVLLYLSTESKSFQVRRAVLTFLKTLASQHPEFAGLMLSAGLRQYLTKYLSSLSKAVESVDEEYENVHSRLSGVALAAVSFGAEVTQEVRANVLVNNLVLVHHQALCTQTCQVNPRRNTSDIV